MKTTFLPKALIALFVAGAALTSCDKDVFDPSDKEGGVYKSALYSPISLTIDEDESLSEYAKALRYSGTFNALNQSTSGKSFTAFVPNNEAMAKFYASRGVSSLEELTPDYVRHFVLAHTVKDSITVDNFVLKTSVNNLEGDAVSIEIDAEHAGQALLNSSARVIEMGISASNGKIYILSGALTPLVETTLDRVKEAGNSSIMLQALEASGWAKELNTVADTTVQNGVTSIRKRFYTLLNVTDEVFGRDGISSYSALTSRLAADDHRNVGVDSLVREYVAYHIMQNEYTLAELAGVDGEVSVRQLGSNARNQIMSIEFDGTSAAPLEERFVFNKDGSAASFVTGQCDVRGRNGYVHNLSSWLPVWEPLQTEVIWDLADYASVKAAVLAAEKDYVPDVTPASDVRTGLGTKTDYVYTVGEGGKGSKNYDEGVSYVTPKKINVNSKYDPEIVKDLANRNDFIVFNVGYMGTVKVKTPVIVKGKYRVELSYPYYDMNHDFIRGQSSGSNGGLVSIQFDDRADINADATSEEIIAKGFFSPYKQVPFDVTGFFHMTLFDEVTFTETSDHVFQMTVMDPAASSSASFYLAFDYIKFVPID